MFQIPDNLVTPEDSDNKNTIFRISGAMGGMFPINEYISIMGGAGVVTDKIYVAESSNYFIGAGVFGQYDPWGIGLGILGGYYENKYRALPYNEDGSYYGTIDDQSEAIARAARFMIIPRLFFSDKIIFLDELSANVGFSEKADAFKILSRLAFNAIQIGAARIGINIYYNQYKYNMLLDQRAFGAKFDSKYLSFDVGYRQFLNTADNPFTAHYKDGMIGRICAKIWIFNNNKSPLLVSYGFEQIFEMRHFFGIGMQVGSNRFPADFLTEFNFVDEGRFGGVLPYIP